MKFLAWLVSFYLPLCGTFGAAGIAPPGVVDFAQLRMKTHSRFLLAPTGLSPTPDEVAPVFDATPAALFSDIQAVAATLPRTTSLDAEPGALQAAWVIRSAVFNFPDIVEIAVVPAPGGRSSVIFYGHAVYGWSDYGVNHQHAIRWFKALAMKVNGSCVVR